MLKLIKNSFTITNDCIILATPLIIFLSILGWYFDYAASSIDNITKLILAAATILIMTSGFAAAWLYMAKKTIFLSKKIFFSTKQRPFVHGFVSCYITNLLYTTTDFFSTFFCKTYQKFLTIVTVRVTAHTSLS